jgi:hypothetical protein
MQSLQQPIQRGEPGTAAEDAIEPRAQHHTVVFAGVGVSGGVNPRLNGAS